VHEHHTTLNVAEFCATMLLGRMHFAQAEDAVPSLSSTVVCVCVCMRACTFVPASNGSTAAGCGGPAATQAVRSHSD